MATRNVWIDFEEVRQKCPLPEVLEVIGILDQFEQTKPNNLQGVCPLPQHEHKSPISNPEQFKMDLKNGQWVWFCHGDCKTGGGVIEFVKRYHGYDDAQTRLFFHQHFADRLEAKKPKKKEDGGKRKEMPKEDEEETNEKEDAAPIQVGSPKPTESKTTSPLIQSSIVSSSSTQSKLKPLRFFLRLTESDYLKKRGLTPETIERFGLGFCPPDPTKKKLLAGYVAFPVTIPIDGEWQRVCYFGRLPSEEFSEEMPTYKWPEGMEDQVIFGLQQALEDSNSPYLVPVQSPFDLFCLRQHGVTNVVSLTKPELTDQQANLLIKTKKHVLLFFHGEEPGRIGMRLAAAKLICRAFVRAVKLNEGRQPEQLTKEELEDFIRH